jgi:hypothetical protein
VRFFAHFLKKKANTTLLPCFFAFVLCLTLFFCFFFNFLVVTLGLFVFQARLSFFLKKTNFGGTSDDRFISRIPAIPFCVGSCPCAIPLWGESRAGILCVQNMEHVDSAVPTHWNHDDTTSA